MRLTDVELDFMLTGLNMYLIATGIYDHKRENLVSLRNRVMLELENIDDTGVNT